ncbi:MAG TPA: putative manganese-dependent inorganic diphosphatase [Candidatus Butyricicoccus avistercoris]|uniref:inorganic diphosphatase n=1 Tax=Candidatus Butyricicoccus avistercoris TaxID=2838518 RepID=A0A9D1PKU0_9FIRM|nr:putative manganese-dependent inorganic diphosphatase [Candidatus Butyricicoccus avistercoris]
MKEVFVIGHKNPDTDSICSAICYAHLKQVLTGKPHTPCRAGQINPETQYVLHRFNVEPPRFLDSLYPRLSNVQYRKISGISADMSLHRAWDYMTEHNIPTIPIVNEQKYLKGMLTFTDIARFHMEGQDSTALSRAKIKYQNICDVLNGVFLAGNPKQYFSEGRVIVISEDEQDLIRSQDLVILTNASCLQMSALRASCVIINMDTEVSEEILMLTEQLGCVIIRTIMDAYTCVRMLNQAIPVSHIMLTNGIITFQHSDFVSDVKSIVSKKRIPYYPILDDDGKYIGMVSQRNLLDLDKQEVILVDHNEKDQSVDGITSAQITEIIDHHRIDTMETGGPIYFRNQPLGCTATIVTQMYQENGIDIPKQIAGLLCSAIISDTLMFRSPTCTPCDQHTAEWLAKIAEIDIRSHAIEMFRSGPKLDNRSTDEIFHTDYKYYQAKGRRIAISQVTSVSSDELTTLEPRMLSYMQSCLPSSGLAMMFVMLTDIIEENTRLLFVGKNSDKLVKTAFAIDEIDCNCVHLQGVVSRKKQMVLPLMNALEELGMSEN